jgi:iron complex transport system substrate-binding protein
MVRPFGKAMLVALFCLAAGAAAAAPRRIVSINMCADQYLIALADRAQIAALSEYSRDASLSFHHREAAAFASVRGNAESILPLKPDLIVGSPSDRFQTRALFHRFGLKIVDLPADDSFADIVDHTRLIARAVGHPARGETLIAQMKADLARLPPASGPKPSAIHYQRQGFVTGTGTLMDEVMRRAGLRNMAGTLGSKVLARVDLETVVAAGPDVILFTDDRRDARDWGAELLRHPALATIRSRQVYVPDNLTVCGGPSFPVAVAALYRAVHRKAL